MDRLADALHAKGYDQAVVDEVVERAAGIEHEGGKTRWKASVEAQMQTLGKVETRAYDL